MNARVVSAAVTAALWLLAACGPAAAVTTALEAPALADAREGLDHLYHARIDEARAAFERIRATHPASPAADFLLGGIEWHRVTTGPAGFTVGGSAQRSFFARMDSAIALGERAVQSDRDDLSARFFLGGAYGYKARYLAIQEKWWSAYRTGRRGVKHLEHVVKRDPEFVDAYLGLGIYHYYTDVLPGVLRFLGRIVGIDGDRERGLREIGRAVSDGCLVQVESRFFLSEIYTTFEKDHWAALAYSRSLRDEFPENELFTWLNARVLDELHLTDLSTREWIFLRGTPRDRGLDGFLEYRLARSRLFGGDFAGAERDLGQLIEARKVGNRLQMWAHLRRGLCLDFLGRHAQALDQYERARTLDASSSAMKRVQSRLAAGDPDPTRISLGELKETARILRSTGPYPEATLRRVEDQVTGPSRGLSRDERDLFFDVLEDLAAARLTGGDPDGCIAALDRALDSWQQVPKNRRASLGALRARALVRAGRDEEARRELDEAYARAGSEMRARIQRDREALQPAAAPPPRRPSDGAEVTFSAPDRGEICLHVEGDFLRGGPLRLGLEDGVWRGTWPVADEEVIRYRFLVDRGRPRIDPHAARVVVADDGAWCEQSVR